MALPIGRMRRGVPRSLSRRCFSSTRTRLSTNLQVDITAPNGRQWTQPLGLFVNNEFIKSKSGDVLSTVNPYTEKEICRVYAAGAEDVDIAVSAARHALVHESWKLLSGTDRARLMDRLASLVEENAEALAAAETLDNGKPLSASRAWDVPELASALRYYAGHAHRIAGSTPDVGHGKLAYTLKQPVGVCGQIIPWNYPLAMAGWKLGPALACGNTVVLKPAEATPLSALCLASLVREAGFPPGVINIVNGPGVVAGAALAAHDGVDKLAFTGSTATGKQVMRAAAGNLKAVTLETGGKSPLIVFDDANIAQAVRWAHEGVMANQGQICTATSRLLVQDGVYDKFIAQLKEHTAKTSILGDPFAAETYQGPQISADQRDRVLAYIYGAKKSGSAEVYQPPAPLPKHGYFVPPTIVTGFDSALSSTPAWNEEIFGPVAAVARFDSEQEALALANDSKYGLAGAVFTQSLSRAHRMARELEAGTVWVNSSNDSDVRVPFGGVKESGIGRELGEEGLRAYYNVKAVHVNLTDD